MSTPERRLIRAKGPTLLSLALLLASGSLSSSGEPLPPETPWLGASLEFPAATPAGYVDPALPGNAVLRIPPTSGPTTISLTWTALETGEVAFAHQFHPENSSTGTLQFPLSPHLLSSGVVLAVARQEPQRLIRWAWVAPIPPPRDPVMAEQGFAASPANPYLRRCLARLDALYDPATTGTWLGNDSGKDQRWMREDIYYAFALLERSEGADRARANAILRTIARSQYLAPSDPLDGLFFYSPVDRPIPDQSCTQFLLPALLWMLETRADRLDPETIAELDVAARRALEFKKRYYGSLSTLSDFTNFQCLAVASLTLGGQRYGDDQATEIGLRQLELLWHRLSTTGFSTEVQSPTYVAVSVWALSFILDQVRDPQVRAPVALLRDRFLLEGALAVHPEANQMAGPYSRSFADGILGGATLTSLLFGWESQRAGWASADRIGPVWEAAHGLDLNPAALIAALPRAGSPAVMEIFRGRSLPLQVRARYLDPGLTTTYLGATGTLGTAVQRLHPQTEGVVIQIRDQANPGGLASGVVRTGADEMDSFLAAPGDSSWVRVAAVQEGPRALVAMRRSFPPGESQLKRAQLGWVMEERLGQWSDLQLDGVELNLAVGESVSLTPGSWLTLRRGKSWLGLNLVSRPEVGVALQVGRVERREGELLVAAHGRDGESLVPAQGVVAEALWAVIIGEEGEYGRRNLNDDLRRREQVEGSHEGSQVVGQWMEPMESLPSPRMRSVLSVRWDRTSLIRMADERLGRNWLQPDALVTAPEMTMPAASARGFGVHGDFAFDGLPSGGWVVGRPGADRVQVSNPTSATVRLRHSYGPEELMVPPWGQVTVIKQTPSQARFWDEYDRGREGE